MALALIVYLAATGVPAQALMDPLAPARAGQLQCHQPDEARKTCRSIASYREVGEGRYSNTAIVLIAGEGPTTLETTTSVHVVDGAICGPVHAADIRKGKLSVAGRDADSAQASSTLEQVASSFAAMAGKEICTSYEPTAGGLIAKVKLGGTYVAAWDQHVIWVNPADGYRVSP